MGQTPTLRIAWGRARDRLGPWLPQGGLRSAVPTALIALFRSAIIALRSAGMAILEAHSSANPPIFLVVTAVGEETAQRPHPMSQAHTERPLAAQVFLSHSEADRFEAELFQASLEIVFDDLGVEVWAYKRDQARDETNIGASLRNAIRASSALIFLLSPATGATQWMELAYADAYSVPTFILLHRTTFAQLRSAERGMPPLVGSSQCTPAVEWKTILEDLRGCCSARGRVTSSGSARS